MVYDYTKGSLARAGLAALGAAYSKSGGGSGPTPYGKPKSGFRRKPKSQPRRAKKKKIKRRRKPKAKSPSTDQCGNTVSVTNIKYKPQKIANMAKVLNPPAVYEVDNVGVMSTEGGKQNSGTIYGVWDQSGLQSILAAGTTTWMVGSTTTQKINQDGTTANYKGIKYLFAKVSVSTKLQNQAPTCSRYTIYDLVSKVTKPTYKTPESDWDDGIVDIRGAGGAAVARSYIGSKPTISKTFNMAWKIVKKSTATVEPGGAHMHYFNFAPNRAVDAEYIAEYGQIRGITTACLVVIEGSGLVDNSLLLATATNITTPPAKMIYLNKKRYVTRAISPYARTYTQVGETLTQTAINVGNYYAQVPGQVAPYNINIDAEYA